MDLNLQNFLNQTKNNQYNSQSWNQVIISNNLKSVQKPTLVPNSNMQNVKLNSNSVKDEFIKHKKQRNLVEKITDGIKNITHVGFGSKKAEKIIQNSTEEEAKKALNKYKATEETAAQTIGDTASAAAGVGVFYGILKGSKYLDAMVKTDAIPSALRNADAIIEKFKGTKLEKYTELIKKLTKGFKNSLSSKKTVVIAGGIAAMLVGGVVKKTLLKPNKKEYRLTKEQKKQLTRKEKRQLKKELKKGNFKENTKNFLTGAINGAAAPLLSLVGVAGAPIYAAGSFLLRHKTAQNDNGTIIEDLKNNAVITTLGTAAVSFAMIKSGKSYNVFAKNMDKVVKELQGKKLNKPDFETAKTTYAELEEILMGDESVREIIHGSESVEEQIQRLTEENIFAVKFKQISNSGDDLTRALRENCPPSRTLEEAQKAIDGLSRAGEYKVDKLLGVGTIAETYLAHDASGKEVCVKILKNGISKEKILQDKEKFAQLITKGAAKKALTEEQRFLLRNLDNLSDGILKEVDFKNEMEAAKKLKAFTKKANVVVPIKAEDGIYVMEKAKGISVDTLSKYCELSQEKEYLELTMKNIQSGKERYLSLEECKTRLAEVEEGFRKLRERAPEFKDFDLSDNEVKKFLNSYIDVYTEQFDKIEKTGKTLHADIHPGNVFVDIEALKSGNGKILTLIDTGNTVNLSAAQSKRALELTNYIQGANSKDITKYVLEGAKLPNGMTQEKAVELVEGEFNKLFFDYQTRLETVTNESLLSTANGIMKKHGIIPNDDQLNLNKARQSAKNSFDMLQQSFFGKKHGAKLESIMDNLGDAIDNNTGKIKEGSAAAVGIAKLGVDYGKVQLRKTTASKIQQIKNLFNNSPKNIIEELRNRNNQKKGSEKYITYKLKQLISSFNPESKFSMFE